MFALDLLSSKEGLVERTFLYTFGAPRTGDFPFALAMTRYVLYSYRVVHAWDPVPHTPTCVDKGHVCWADSALHYGREIWVEKDSMVFTVHGFDDYDGSNSGHLFTGVAQHSSIFGDVTSGICDSYGPTRVLRNLRTTSTRVVEADSTHVKTGSDPQMMV